MQGTFIFPNRESIRIPISRALIHPLKSMPFPTQRTKTLPNTILNFLNLCTEAAVHVLVSKE